MHEARRLRAAPVRWDSGVGIAAALALGASLTIVGADARYTPGSGLGYGLGLCGGLMMLALLIYPLRKSVAALHAWGPIKYWFRAHMILGVVGPLMILFHSTFHFRSSQRGGGFRLDGPGRHERFCRSLSLRADPSRPLWQPRHAGGNAGRARKERRRGRSLDSRGSGDRATACAITRRWRLRNTPTASHVCGTSCGWAGGLGGPGANAVPTCAARWRRTRAPPGTTAQTCAGSTARRAHSFGPI